MRIAATALVALALAGCSVFNGNSAQPLPTVVLGDGNAATQPAEPASPRSTGGQATASGIVVLGQEVQLAFSVGEKVKTVEVKAGDAVKAGQVLATLDDAVIQAQLRQAQSAVATAQANYDLLAAGPTSGQLRQAESALISARAAYSRTVEGARKADIDAARSALNAAYANYAKVKAGPQQEQIAGAEAALRTAEAAVRQAQSAYDQAKSRNPAGISGEPAALALEKATNDFNAAKAVYDALAKPADDAQLSAAYQQVVAAKAQLDRLVKPAQVFDMDQAQAAIDSAQAQLDELKAGPRPAELAAAQAQVDSAQAALQVLEAQAGKYTLVAPLDGVVLSHAIEPGETALPGTPVLVLADVTHLRVETTDLSELDVPKVEVGQAARVFVKALGLDVAGRVSLISPQADTLGGDVVYKTTIELDEQPAGLRAGMSVEVQFGAGQ